MAQPVVGETEMHSVANLATLLTPLATFFPFKKTAKPYLVSETLRYCRARSYFLSARTSLSLSLKHRYYVASLLHASIAKITLHLLSLSYGYLISSDDGSIIRIFVQINILKGRAGCVGLICRVSITISYFIPLSDNRNSKIYK